MHDKRSIGMISIKVFFALFAFVFTIVVGSVIFANNVYDCTPAVLLLLIGSSITLMLLIYRTLGRYMAFLERHYKAILVSGLILLFTANVVAGYMLRYEPAFDLGAIFTGAAKWASTGKFMGNMNLTCDPNYFYYFPNNLGGMSLLFVAFKIASWFALTDYFAIAMIMNGLLATATVLLTALICKRLFGIKQSILALVFFLLSPPFYLIAPVFYTDSLSLVFPVLVVHLYLLYADSKTTAAKATLASLIGLSCAIGMLVKFTVVIALIAIIIYRLCTKGIISALPLTATSGIVIIAVFVAFNAYFYSTHLDKDMAEKLNTPYSHWIMMSLEGDGRYNPEDYEFTQSFEDPSERKAAISNRIKERIEEKGLMGMLKLFYKKGVIVFGDGTYAQSDFLDDDPVNDTALHSLVLYDGSHYEAYRYICSGIYFSLQLLMLVSAYGELLKKRQRQENALPLLCVFGIMLFLMLWEVSGRYATNYIPMIIIAAVSGLDVLTEALNPSKYKN